MVTRADRGRELIAARQSRYGPRASFSDELLASDIVGDVIALCQEEGIDVDAMIRGAYTQLEDLPKEDTGS